MPSTIEYEDDSMVIIQNISPQAKTHVLLIPKEHILQPPAELSDEQALMLGRFFSIARQFAEGHGLLETGYKLKNNNGEKAGQTVEHFHVHLMSDKAL